MNTSKGIGSTMIAAIGLAALAVPLLAANAVKVDFSSETVGAEPKSMIPVVGVWRIEDEAGEKVLAVDGRQWKEG
jgi:hypothetical protein